MVDFLKKRLQVFVSSTFTDLRYERQAAVEAILSAGHIPAGMELFTAGDESQMEVIRQWIDESDVYCLILGGRYGSVEPKSGKSYTEIEYEYALEQNKPLFACVINEAALEKRVKEEGRSVIETENPQKLKQFRTSVLSKMVRFWDDSKDIKIAIGETLSYFARKDDLMGWVRSKHEGNVPALADEITRLSRENARLRAQIDKEELLIGGLTFTELNAIVASKKLFSFLEENRRNFVDTGMAISSKNVEELKELETLGLVKSNTDYSPTRYQLTQEGRMFLNRVEAAKLGKNVSV